ncbi:unnamed protein product [Durusdinium trenchii]|uniref:N'-adenosyl(rRNA) dimethyltransferase n=3 Tax=Durusdinium trenchii TaxID=1381693 RepID=A0ABP0L4G7_9DINO
MVRAVVPGLNKDPGSRRLRWLLGAFLLSAAVHFEKAWSFALAGLIEQATRVSRQQVRATNNREVLLAERERLEGENGKKEGAIQPLSWLQKPKPPTLPADLFKPKESLSQTFLADPNYIFKMVSALDDESEGGKRTIELGPGTGAITSRLWQRYPEMIGIEIDQRAMRVLSRTVPGATVIRSDVLMVNYTKLAELRGGPLSIVSNLPFHVASQALFTLADHADGVRSAHVILQQEVAQRLVAKPNSKKYGIPSVVFQLYADPKILFHLPPTAYFPRPNVMTSYVKLDFEAAAERRRALDVDPRDLRNLTNTVFRYRRKMMQNSLARILSCHTTLIDQLPEEYAKLRPEQIEPWEFVHLTQLVFGKKEFPKHFKRAWRGEFGRTVRD